MAAADEPLSLQTETPGRVALRGALTFATVEDVAEASSRVLSAQQAGRVEVDLGGVTHADSAGLALLIGWLAAARQSGIALGFRAVPERLRAIARISEVEDLLAETPAA